MKRLLADSLLNKKSIWLGAAALVLAGSLSVGSAMAYFTTFTSASGGYQISLGSQTTITETFSDWTKHITVTNNGTNPCYIRVKAFAPSQFTIQYSGDASLWQENADGYWYYTGVVEAKASTSELAAKINVPESQKDSFDVVVIQECTPVSYDESGNPYADWTKKVDTTTGIGEGATN